MNRAEHARTLRRILAAYDSPLARLYGLIRFGIINTNILQILSLCLRGKERVLDLGCGFGLLGCYFAMRNPSMQYLGYDLSARRVAAARRAAARLGLANITFECADARSLKAGDLYDAILAVDLLHHVDRSAQRNLLLQCRSHLLEGGHLVIKDVTLRPRFALAFTWLIDLVMTQSLDMWYMSERDFRNALDDPSWTIEVYPVSTLLPFPHIVYLCHRASGHPLAAPSKGS